MYFPVALRCILLPIENHTLWLYTCPCTSLQHRALVKKIHWQENKSLFIGKVPNQISI